jgi:chromosome segregation ATPase
LDRTIPLAAIIVSIIGIAMTLFASETFLAIGFGLVGLASLWMYVRAGNMAQLQQIETGMTKSVTAFDQANKKAQDLEGQLQVKTAEFQKNQEKLQAQIARMEDGNTALARERKEWAAERAHLKAQIDPLKQANDELTANIKALKGTNVALKANLQEFLRLNLKMAQDVKAFEKVESELTQNTATLQQAIDHLNQDSSSIVAQLRAGKDATETLFTAMTQEIKNSQQKLQEALGEVQQVTRLWEKAKADLEAQLEKSQEATAQIEAATKDLEEQQKKFNQDTDRQIAESKKLEEKRAELETESARLKEMTQQIQQAGADLQQRLANQNTLFEAKQKQIADLNTQILAKTVELHKLKAKAAA